MPQVPTYNSFQATPNTTPNAGFQVQNIPDIAGRQAQQFGQGLSNAGNVMSNIATDLQQQANQVRVDDALNQAKEAALTLAYDKDKGFTNLKGVNALHRPDGKPLAEEYGGALEDRISNLSQNLGNDAQRQIFQMHANDIMTQFKGQLQQHAAQEYKTYSLSTSEGIQNTAMRDISLNWNNPDAVNSAVDRINAETYRKAGLLGYSAEWQQAESRNLTSQAHSLAIASALESNQPQYAQAYFNTFKPQMNADDILRVHGQITNEMNGVLAMGAANKVLSMNADKLNPSNGSRLFNLVIGQESGGRQLDSAGNPITSSKGAIGIAQVMPATAPEAAKLAGLPWDENRYKTDPEYNKALGQAYLNKQLQDFGDYRQALSAYNAGPARTRDALMQAEADGKADQWVSYLPKETQGYVNNISSKYEAGLGASSKPTLLDLDNQLQQDPNLANNPKALAASREVLSQRFQMTVQAQKQRDDESVMEAMKQVEANGGDFYSLPAEVRANIPRDKVNSVKEYAKNVYYGADITDLSVYQDLTTHPEKLKNMSDAELYSYRKVTSVADFKRLVDMQESLRNPGGPSARDPSILDSGMVKQVVDSKLRLLNIDPSPKSGSDDDYRNGAIRNFIDTYLLTQQRMAGKKFNQAEINSHVDTIISQSDVIHRTFLPDRKVPLLSMGKGDVESNELERIKYVLEKKGFTDPTDGQIMNLYWLEKVTQ